MLAAVILVCHFGLLTLLGIYGWQRLRLTRLCLRNRAVVPPPPLPAELPQVTVQLPVYNEKYVVERLIDAAARLRYPADRLQIQVLDDSTDETTVLAAARVHAWRRRGVDIAHLRRGQRTGFKAGALAAGLTQARGELVAIFDADFVPDADLLLAIVPYFSDPGVGMVQARWAHLNRGCNAITQVQAMMLDAHFVIEHGGRCAAGLFFNFNGTAGLWRAATIRDAGGWTADTLTEDLDLSYRAQLRGWRFVFLPTVTCAGELPVEMCAFKVQQHRWAKGATQVMLKLLPQIWAQPLPLRTKVEATFHLSSNVAYLLMVLDSLVFLPSSIVIRHGTDWAQTLWIDAPLFLFATLSHLCFFLSAQWAISGRLRTSLRYLPALMSVGIGLGLTNARAVIEALVGRSSAFVRTPKRGLHALGRRRPRPHDAYRVDHGGGWAWVEVAAGALYAGFGAWAIYHGAWLALPFLLLFLNGFLLTGVVSLLERRARR